ncbi:peptidase S10 [Pseudoduganella sp. DS3]|uniref:Peptidase S10 n=1 Tax=Pseudoduganella guangdongensis TaxID=2692179 RepID=A0A6N9HIV2_9BURK|nr:peptidase S10 [Pseudoduganella guangdongensis]MYN03279.1 peptidase S10 [Pseudoduganella guangdongensis]
MLRWLGSPIAPAALAAALLAACGGGDSAAPAAPPPPTVPGALADATIYSGAATASLAAATEASATARSQLTLNGTRYDYTATTGHLTARDAVSGAATVSFFYVAYTLDNQPAANRPLTFFYNGGPGSASLWLHLGSYGPKRLVADQPSNAALATPAQIVDNAESMLDISDLVFVDAVGTGYTQAIAPNRNQDFWSVDSDAASLRDFVQRYVAANNRQASPKYLFGESYGGPRTAVLAKLLETAGTRLAGIVLQAPILDYNANCGVFEPGPREVSCEGYVPTYAAIGAYHQRANPLPTDFSAYIAQARSFAAGAYRSAMTPWLAARLAPPPAVAVQLNAYTGIATANWQQNPNLRPDYVQRNVLPASMLAGRYDARVAAALGSPLASGGDPSLATVNQAFVSGIRSYLADTLRYTAGSAYLPFNDFIERWNFSHDGKAVPDTVPDLAAAMTLNPALKVLSLSGYYDLATPFYQTELDLARLGANPNIVLRNYHSGHMGYLDNAARRATRADLGAFYQMGR